MATHRSARRLDALVLAVCIGGAGVVAALLIGALTFAPVHLTTTLIALGIALVLGELRPVKVARGEEGDDEITISSTFAMALVMTGPLAFAVGAQIGAAFLDDMRRRKPLVEKLERTIGFRPQTSLREIIQRTAESI